MKKKEQITVYIRAEQVAWLQVLKDRSKVSTAERIREGLDLLREKLERENRISFGPSGASDV